jgi:hypothetical protein
MSRRWRPLRKERSTFLQIGIVCRFGPPCVRQGRYALLPAQPVEAAPPVRMPYRARHRERRKSHEKLLPVAINNTNVADSGTAAADAAAAPAMALARHTT